MAKKTTAPKTVRQPRTRKPKTALDPQRVAVRAYELYLARGGAPGSAEADWLEAERQLRAHG